MFSILIIYEAENLELLITELKTSIPDIDVHIWPEVENPEKIEAIITWKPPLGIMSKFPNLKVIISLGAGVEDILRDPNLPQDVPIVRIVEPCVTSRMTEYILLAVLRFHRQAFTYQRLQKAQHWKPLPISKTSSCYIGILGLGVLGTDAAQKLKTLGFPIRGWSRTPKNIDGIECFYGRDQLKLCLSKCRVLVCLLPLTLQTKGILNHETFSAMPCGSYLINVARGEHLVEKDLLEALDSGQLSGACLDVFSKEPLPENHPFWSHPQITITPHIATQTNSEYWTQPIVDAIHCIRAGQTLKNVVNYQQGY
ncbi:MAG: glyoxylate/hydroxypyruvate reductase A [Calothrix sp. MO_192.B10]|nr:glyoxylate/hydroxypyruvate reductase A [Calothrix sp. MO_192.B10]